tara:strand:- start:729 stop:2003 length:1275 start_codon:yes stop_codon:yes gene_type:complete
MNYCKRCIYPENHPLGILFDNEGVCSGCRVHEEKDEINWIEKEQEFEKILSLYRNKNNEYYDCIIPVNGNGDSFFVVDTLKNKFGMNPLLVTYNNQFSTKVGIRNLSRLITKLDCDHLLNTVGPDTVKKITKITLKKIGDIYWHVLAGNQTFPVQVAVKFNIPLIIWGVHGWLDQVGMFSHYDQVEMTKKVRKEHGLRGIDAESLIGEDKTLSPKDLQAFTYPSNEDIEKINLRGLYLGNYVRWDSQMQTEKMIEKYGYETAFQERTFNKYESIYCMLNAGMHDYIKFLKYGYGKATDHACRDIRLNRITREEGILFAKEYDSVVPESFDTFLNWLKIDKKTFYKYIDPFRDSQIWNKDQDSWELKDSVSNHINDSGLDEVRLPIKDQREYKETKLLEDQSFTDDYILMGRSYMDIQNYKAVEG